MLKFWMPQMTPMNWVVLFIMFNLALGLSMCKLHFLLKEKSMLVSEEYHKLNKAYFPQIK